MRVQVKPRMRALSSEQVVYQSDFNAAISQLRYALHLQEERAAKAAKPPAAGDAPDGAGPSGSGASTSTAPASGAPPSPDENAPQAGNAGGGGPNAAAKPASAAEAAVSAAAAKHTAVAQAVLAQHADGEHEEDECPVCCEPFGAQCVMGPCMHRWCQPCHGKLKKMAAATAGAPKLKCPLCNVEIGKRACMVVSLEAAKPAEAAEEDAPPPAPAGDAGAYGTKVQAVVQAVQSILCERPDDKARYLLGSCCGVCLRHFNATHLPIKPPINLSASIQTRRTPPLMTLELRVSAERRGVD